MLVNIQRVSSASVQVGEETVSSIGLGLLILVCAMPGDTNDTCERVAEKMIKIRLFNDTLGKMNRSLIDVNGSILMVSQFTLAADTTRGNRPGFSSAAPPDKGEELYEYFIKELNKYDIDCKKGVFGGDMKISLVNDGPTTIWLDNADFSN